MSKRKIRKYKSNCNSKLIASWNFTELEISQILANNNRNISDFVDASGIYIAPDMLDLVTIEEYFEEVKIDMFN